MDNDTHLPPREDSPANSPTYLITGAGGFIGARVLSCLLGRGAREIRCMARPSSNLGRLKAVLAQHPNTESVEIVVGDLLSLDDCLRAAEGVSIVLHLAAGVEKSFAGSFMNSALATRNLMDAFLKVGRPGRFVNVSSFALYSNLGLRRQAVLDETCPLETAPQERNDAYGFGKLKQEQLVRRYGEDYGLSYVILRPGAVFGAGKPGLSGRVGIDTFGFFLHLGGSNRIPLTYVDNCAEAIVLAGLVPGVEGEVFNVVDDDLPTSRELLRVYKRATGRRFSLPVPYPVARLLSAIWERYSRWSQGQLPPVFNHRRCAAEWKGNLYPNAKLKERLGWKPTVPMNEALKRFLSQFG